MEENDDYLKIKEVYKDMPDGGDAIVSLIFELRKAWKYSLFESYSSYKQLVIYKFMSGHRRSTVTDVALQNPEWLFPSSSYEVCGCCGEWNTDDPDVCFACQTRIENDKKAESLLVGKNVLK